MNQAEKRAAGHDLAGGGVVQLESIFGIPATAKADANDVARRENVQVEVAVPAWADPRGPQFAGRQVKGLDLEFAFLRHDGAGRNGRDDDAFAVGRERRPRV